ncbi:DUF5694 domain-containing protein [Luteibacter aegosomatissinici]|uniref:DUF5694 domain-containing protein n=1 Tax=Luteibacter aegosomatissinici TaxID=2911539 RepID=UPI001FF72470|nr:DUF5694 domain-containing protein [Luteibacter aegosomatissinici]UPG92538.1 DUF5694 domain-containing protein [Luteibacter aegosomatissinici]
MTYRWILLSLLALAPLAATAAQEKPTMMFLGSGHLANHNRDIANTHVEDILVAKRQAEIESVVNQLAAWKPTHVAVEYPHARQAQLDERYAAYRAGTYKLTADEVDQIGLRLARKLGLPRVDAVDWNENAPGQDADYDWMAWAKANGKGELLDKTVNHWKAMAVRETDYLKDHSILQWYQLWNDPERMHEDESGYFDMALFGNDTNNPGAAWVGQWYARNLRIFTHIRELATKPGDRILVIYGAGHGPYLRKDATESGIFELTDTYAYLKAMHP